MGKQITAKHCDSLFLTEPQQLSSTCYITVCFTWDAITVWNHQPVKVDIGFILGCHEATRLPLSDHDDSYENFSFLLHKNGENWGSLTFLRSPRKTLIYICDRLCSTGIPVFWVNPNCGEKSSLIPRSTMLSECWILGEKDYTFKCILDIL